MGIGDDVGALMPLHQQHAEGLCRHRFPEPVYASSKSGCNPAEGVPAGDGVIRGWEPTRGPACGIAAWHGWGGVLVLAGSSRSV